MHIPLVDHVAGTKRIDHPSSRELRALAARLQSAREDERAQIASEVHDVVGQALTGLRMDLDWLERRVVAGPDANAIRERLADMSRLIATTLENVRRISRALRPGVLDDLGLVAAVEWQARDFETRSGIRVNLAGPDEIAVDGEVATAVFRIFQEILTNVARHAGATEVWVELSEAGGRVVLTVADDGSGFDPSQIDGLRSLGIPLMRERSLHLGGSVQFDRREPNGTVVKVAVPIARPPS